MHLRKLRPGGGYRALRSFQVATLIYDGTVRFCDTHLDRRSRTHDQMVQAARSGRQNIAEGNRIGATSSKSELHLTNVARASLEELLLDYEDFLRQRDLSLWPRESPEAHAVRQALWNQGQNELDSVLTSAGDAGSRARWQVYRPWLDQPDPVLSANALICLIHQANYLLDQQIAAMEQAFIQGGGYTESLAAARLRHRSQTDQSDRSDPSDPTDPPKTPPPHCPRCQSPMLLRTARTGSANGSRFWGCPAFPTCKSTLPLQSPRLD